VILVALVQGIGAQPTPASTLGFAISVVFNYFANRRWTFRSGRAHARAAPRFFLVQSVGLCLNGLLLYLGAEVLGVNYLLAQLFATAVVLVWNFFAHLLWSFAAD
jgi:putative flippase GtrA